MYFTNPAFPLKARLKTWLHNLGYAIETNHVNAFADQQLIFRQLPTVKTIFDLGANLGKVVDRYQNLFPQANLYAFEPFPDIFRDLNTKFQNQPQIKTYPIAITNKTGKHKLFVNNANVMNSLLPVAQDCHNFINPYHLQSQGSIEVETITLDDFCQQENITTINILKMDIQGGEIMALQGAKKLLDIAAIDLIYTEVLFGKLYEQQASFEQICTMLKQYNYELYGLYNFNYGNNGALGWGDAIFISSKVAKTLPKSW